MSKSPEAVKPEIRDAMRQWLEQKNFSHFVTLAVNDPMAREELLRRRLKDWDARMNRRIAGPKWQKSDKRLMWFAFQEKQDVNPHWHLLLSAPPEQHNAIEAWADFIWMRLVSSGSTNIQRIYSSDVIQYVTKDLHKTANYSAFCSSLELIRAGM